MINDGTAKGISSRVKTDSEIYLSAPSAGKKSCYSQNRTNNNIYRAFCIALSTRANNPVFDGTTVLRTRLSADGSCVQVYLTVRGNETEQQKVIAAFIKSSGFFKGEIAKTVSLRRVPKLTFIIDKGNENADRVEKLLQQIHKAGGAAGRSSDNRDNGGK